MMNKLKATNCYPKKTHSQRLLSNQNGSHPTQRLSFNIEGLHNMFFFSYIISIWMRNPHTVKNAENCCFIHSINSKVFNLLQILVCVCASSSSVTTIIWCHQWPTLDLGLVNMCVILSIEFIFATHLFSLFIFFSL